MRKVKIDVGRKVLSLSVAIVACLVLLLSTAAVTAAEPVDLFLLVDGTGSISGANFTLQQEGYAYAINDSSVVPQDGSVSVCIIMFGYFDTQWVYPSKVEVNLTTITNQTVADSVSAQIMAMTQPGDQTAIDSAFILANDTLNSFGDRPGRQIIDIATDGRPNINETRYYNIPFATAAAYAARNASVEKGYFDEVNSLGVDVEDEAGREFMKNLVYSGFYMEASNYTEFKDEIKEKLKREITGISITKSVNKTVCSPGDGLKYTIEYNNTGNVTLTGVILNDTIPANTTLVIGSISGTGTESGGVITWNIGNLNVGVPGSQSFEVRVNDSVANGTQIINTATINSNEVGPVSDDATTTVTSGPILGISKDVNATTAKPNDVLTYTINYENTGNADATNTVINDTIPDNTTYVAGSATGGGVYYAANKTIIWNIGTLLAPGSGVVSFEVTVNASVANGTVITNVATINSTEYGPVSDDATTTVEFKEFELCPKKNVDKSVAAPNETLSYWIYYKNTGTGTLTNVTIKDTIPDDTTYVDGSLTGLNCNYYPVNRTIICDIGTLTPGVDGNVTFEVTINASVPGGTVIHNCVVLTSDQDNPPDPCADTIVTRPPAAVPVLTPIGIIALIGLLSLVAIGSISIRRRHR